MWEFLTQVLEKGGTTAVLFSATLISFVLALRELWAVNTKLHQQAIVQQVSHERALKQKDIDHLNHLKELTASYADRIDELQEKRVDETRAIVTEIVRHVADTQRSVDKITVALQTLTEVVR